jgi:hypothetical protein
MVRENFDPANLQAFRHQHPEGDNLVLAHDVERPFTQKYGTLQVRFKSLRPSPTRSRQRRVWEKRISSLPG